MYNYQVENENEYVSTVDHCFLISIKWDFYVSTLQDKFLPKTLQDKHIYRAGDAEYERHDSYQF